MSRSEPTPSHHHAPGAHRAPGRGRRTGATAARRPVRPPEAYEPYLDGLFTYCLSVLCDHDAAVAALGDTLAVAERAHHRLRDPRMRRPWIYAVARWACLLRFADGRPVAFRAPPQPDAGTAGTRRRALAALAWPEAAGTTPEQREVIELAVRHQLSDTEIAAVLRLTAETARARLSRAACEVERTRTALAVVRLGGCPHVARLATDTRLLLSTALRRELVRHVDDCPACRRTAERAAAPGPWPGTTTPAVLTVLTAPRAAVQAAAVRSARALRTGTAPGEPRRPTPHFDRRGFPVDGKERAARRALVRHRAVTTTVVAAVVAAPALALWAAYRPAPASEDAQGPASVSATDSDGDSYAYERTGSSQNVTPRRTGGSPSPSVPASPSASAPRPSGSPGPSSAPDPATPSGSGDPASSGPAPAPGWITVRAEPRGGVTAVTITAHGDTPVRWNASVDAPWLRLNRTSGRLRPGESVTVAATVDPATEPSGPWNARITVGPGGSTVTVQGQGAGPTPSTSPSASPTQPAVPAAR